MPHVESHVPSTINWVDFVSTDPGGAAVGVWQADQHIGAGVVQEPGAMTWWEVNTRAFEDCRRLYAAVFGWSAEPLEAPGVNYDLEAGRPDGRRHAGDDPGVGGYPLGLDDLLRRHRHRRGGRAGRRARRPVGAPPFDTAFGRIAVLVDPAGGHFSVVTPTQPAAG